jgi:hypothetical protein
MTAAQIGQRAGSWHSSFIRIQTEVRVEVRPAAAVTYRATGSAFPVRRTFE